MRLLQVLVLGLVVALGFGAAADQVEISFWAAPNPPQEVFWREMATAYMAEHPGVRITVRQMPETPTSEAGIMAAIAGGVAPTASENVFIGFGGELADAGAIIALDELPGWDELVAARTMERTIASWQFADEHFYVLPVYSNPMLFAWRIDILQELGFDAPPRTYSELLEVGDVLRAEYPRKYVWVRGELEIPTWYQRWFDFFPLYYGASGGQQLITGDQITADSDAAAEVLGLLREMVKRNHLVTEALPYSIEEGHTIMAILGPWTFPYWAEMYPELEYGVDYVVSPPPVPDRWPEDEPIATFADAKGIAIYAQATPQEREAMWEFLTWVYSDPANDRRWLEITTMPPARDDVAENEIFAEFFERLPVLISYAENIPNAVPPFVHTEYVELKRILGAETIFPAIIGELSPHEAWSVWEEAAQRMLDR